MELSIQSIADLLLWRPDRFSRRRVICTRPVKESWMLRRTLFAAGAAAVLLGGCGYGYYDRYGYYDHDYVGTRVGYYDGYGDRYDPYYDRVNVYYDGYYGPYYDGYWGVDGFFYFSDSDGHRWTRDTSGHFRRTQDSGFMPVRSQRRP
jgi:hypothetical protein